MPKGDKDYYEILGIPRNASPDEIKRGYRRLARQYHPDVNKSPGTEEKFKEINEAYQVLSDPQKRAQYDQFGRVGPEFRGFEGFDFGDLFGRGFEGFGDFGDLFESFFGRPRARRGGREERGDDIRYDLKIPLEVVASGGEKEIEIVHLIACEKCRGSGVKPGTTPIRCSTCNGAGQVSRVQRTPFGSFSQITTCPTCRGVGEVIPSPCDTCRGSGRVKGSHKIKIKIPHGIESGYRLRIPEAGNAGIKGGPPGDLYVFIEVMPHPVFEREESDLHLRKIITFVQATLGGEIEIETLKGVAKLKIPPGTQGNTVFRLKGEGLPHLHGRGTGDLYTHIEVETPTNLTAEQIDLLKKFGKLRGEIRE